MLWYQKKIFVVLGISARNKDGVIQIRPRVSCITSHRHNIYLLYRCRLSIFLAYRLHVIFQNHKNAKVFAVFCNKNPQGKYI